MPTVTAEPEYLSTRDIARRYSFAVGTVAKWITRGVQGKKLAARRIGREWRVAVGDFEAWLAWLAGAPVPQEPTPTARRREIEATQARVMKRLEGAGPGKSR